MSEGPRNHSFFQNYSADRLDGLVAASWTPAAPIRANAAHCGGSGGAASFLTQRPSRSMSRSGHCPLLSLSLSLSLSLAHARSISACENDRREVLADFSEARRRRLRVRSIRSLRTLRDARGAALLKLPFRL
jgi:hypothetical protein